ncbi:prepilin [Achromobacter pestifer]|nr:prepilin [Achromobacter pestifer]
MRTSRQVGFSLPGLALALALTSIVAIWASSQVVQRIEDSAARSAGVWMAQVRQAASGMLARHFDALAKGQAPVNEAGAALLADPASPTVSELRTLAYLPADFPERSALGFGAQIRVHAGGGCPGKRCRIDALVYSATPVLKSGTQMPDLIGIASVIEAAGGYGGAVWPGTPGQVRGAAFSFDNPLAPGMPSYPPGTLALWAGAGAELGADEPPAFPDLNPFVRIGDARDPQLAGGLTVASSVAAGAYLSVGARGQAGHACGVVNGTMASSYAGDLLACQSGVWQPASGGFGGAFSSNNRFGCQHYTGQSTANPRTGGCSCPAGYQAVIVSAGGKWTETEGWTTGYVCVR